MFTTTLLVFCYLLPYLGFAALVSVWCPSRRNDRFSSSSWIIAAYFIGFCGSLLLPPIVGLFPDWTKSLTSDLVITQIYCAAIIKAVTGLINFLILWMITANLAYLIHEKSAGNVVTGFFAKMHSCQKLYGRCLIFCSLLPSMIILFQCFYGCPPQYNK